MCGGIGALSSKEVGSGTIGHIAELESSLVGRRDLEPQDMWQCVDARPSPWLILKLVRGGTWSAGYRLWPPDPPQRGNEPAGVANIYFPRTVLLEYDSDDCGDSAVLPVDRCPLQISASCHSAPLGK
jgi:hypothetical protein